METPRGGWEPSSPDRVAYERRRRRRRVRRSMLWVLTAVTSAVLAVIYLMVRDMARTPTVAAPAALSSSAHAPAGASPSGARRRLTPKPAGRASAAAKVSEVSDPSSGLSYRLLPSPWRRGCPSSLNTPVFSWSAGESAVAGHPDIGGTATSWYANACSGRLQQQFSYSGPGDLEPTAMSLAGALDPAYYSGLQHYRTVEGSAAMRVSGHPAWVVRFLMRYPDAGQEDLSWNSELGAVVLVDRGAGQAPAIFYLSVPGDLGTGNVRVLIDSLRLAS